ncbi:MAG: DUF2242 domain-containing protein [Sulfuricella sp.]|nr:DUF2242 domain-containing protein [Sulfuricella sp.]
MTKWVLAALAAVFLVTGCASHEAKRGDELRGEGFKEDSPFVRNFRVAAAKACESAQMALLSQGYRVSDASPKGATGQKDFQVDSENFASIEIKVVCMERAPGAIVFASAVQSKYELRKSRQSTSLGIPVIGSLSLPLGTTPESLVKVGSETISEWEFYSSFFDLVKSYLE